ncbi:MAG: polysaccharide biosynthesis/export family protein [Candidatus Omnitrophica bacterium]|nr:polysaccharide biosynthesis/export family protein [Candidatus Omnitrophota bacterium]MBU4487712.1 polysaccharide biosynthesis/export family protein [Candidatus Omnitrophota bacterium]MCG2705818.1 polysaccharide biosynthesis/export family protein [Candidatus Omnitrophota bacterium]
MADKRLTITEVAKSVGVTPRTIMRWEKSGKIKKQRRDWRGWRFYTEEDIGAIKEFVDSAYEYDSENGMLVNASKRILMFILIPSVFIATFLCDFVSAEEAATNFAPVKRNAAVVETPTTVNIDLNALPAVTQPAITSTVTEDVKYTLGPNDIVAIEVRRHPEFSGQYTITSEGKIEYKFVGDILVNGLTKLQLKDRVTEILSEYLIAPEVDVTIAAYMSKVYYVVGDVNHPGKFYMRGNTMSIREALVEASLPNQAAAMRRCRLITPNATGRNNYIDVDVYTLLYEGDLRQNFEMKPGDVLYVPATVIAKMIRIISPVTDFTAKTAGTAVGAAANAMVFIP